MAGGQVMLATFSPHQRAVEEQGIDHVATGIIADRRFEKIGGQPMLLQSIADDAGIVIGGRMMNRISVGHSVGDHGDQVTVGIARGRLDHLIPGSRAFFGVETLPSRRIADSKQEPGDHRGGLRANVQGPASPALAVVRKIQMVIQ